MIRLSEEQRKEIQHNILEVMYDGYEKGNSIIMPEDITAKIEVDLQTVISEAERMARQKLIKFLPYGPGVRITEKGIQLWELSTGAVIPSFYNEPLPKRRKALEQRLRKLWQIRGQSDSTTEFARLKIEEIDGELERLDRRATRRIAWIALIISFISVATAMWAMLGK